MLEILSLAKASSWKSNIQWSKFTSTNRLSVGLMSA